MDWIASDIYEKGTSSNPSGWHTEGGYPSQGTGIGDLMYTEFTEDGFGNKPWMVSEFGSNANLQDAASFYAQIENGLVYNEFPNFQAYMVFDNYCSQIDRADAPGEQCNQNNPSPTNLPEYIDNNKQCEYIQDIADLTINNVSVWHNTPTYTEPTPNCPPQ